MRHLAGRITIPRMTESCVSERFGNEKSLPASTTPRRELLASPWNGHHESIELRWNEPLWNVLPGSSNDRSLSTGHPVRWNDMLQSTEHPARSIGLPFSVKRRLRDMLLLSELHVIPVEALVEEQGEDDIGKVKAD